MALPTLTLSIVNSPACGPLRDSYFDFEARWDVVDDHGVFITCFDFAVTRTINISPTFKLPPAHGLPATVNHLRSRLIFVATGDGCLVGKPAASTSNHKAFRTLVLDADAFADQARIKATAFFRYFSSLRWCCHQLF